jgi:2OG-Fe(II) oxygenase superfamily
MRSLQKSDSPAAMALCRRFFAGFALLNNGGLISKQGITRSALFATKRRMSSSISTAEDNMAHVQNSVEKRADEIIRGLQSKGWVVIDNFLGADVCSNYRTEAVGYFTRNEMTISKSTRWDLETSSVVTYDKHNVYATQLNGGDSYYDGPRLHEYVVSVVKSLVPIVSNIFPDACLNPVLASNKLAVCTGDGSHYDKHYDNSGGDDLRKLTVLYYLNPKWRADMGGSFRIYESINPTVVSESGVTDNAKSEIEKEIVTTDIEPIGDRLLVFWSDRLVHSVQPSEVCCWRSSDLIISI